MESTGLKQILIVDDEPMLRESLAERFEISGYATQTAGSADEAMSILVSGQFDVLITDVNMPGGTGYDLVGLTRFVDGKIPVILISGNDDEELMAAQSNGSKVFCCLSKPIDTEALFKAVEEAIDQNTGDEAEMAVA